MHSLTEVHGHSRGSSRNTCVGSLSVTVRWEINTNMPCMSSDGMAVTRITKIAGYDAVRTVKSCTCCWHIGVDVSR